MGTLFPLHRSASGLVFLKHCDVGEVSEKLNTAKKVCGVDGLTMQRAAWAAVSLWCCRARPGGHSQGVREGQMGRAENPQSHLLPHPAPDGSAPALVHFAVA